MSDTPTDRKVSKEVSITAYTKRYETDQQRDFLAALLNQTDWDGDAYDESTSESKDYYVVFGSGDDAEKVSVSSREYQNLCEQRDSENIDLGDVTFDVEITHSTSYTHGTYSLSNTLCEQLALTLPDEIAGYVRETETDDGPVFSSADRWVGPDDRSVSLSMGSPSSQRVLRHQQERDGDDRFETEQEFLALSLSVDMDSHSQDHVEKLSANIVKPLYDRISGFEGVWKVRLSDCKTVQESYGDCYDL